MLEMLERKIIARVAANPVKMIRSSDLEDRFDSSIHGPPIQKHTDSSALIRSPEGPLDGDSIATMRMLLS